MLSYFIEYYLVRAAYSLAALIPIATAVYFYSRYKINYWKRRGVEQLPNTHWFFGDFKDAILFRSAPGWHLKELFHRSSEYTPFFGFYIFQKPCLLVKDPEMVKQMFVKDSECFSDRYFSGQREKDSIGMRNLFGLRNPTWRYLRSKITPTFTLQKVRKMLPLMLESGRVMMKYIDELESNENGAVLIDGQDLNIKYATDIIANVGFGIQTDSFNDPDSEFSRRTQDFFHSLSRFLALMSVFFVHKLADLVGPIVYFDVSFIKKLFWETVEAREKSGVARGDYIDSILKLKNDKQDNCYKLEGENLLNQSGQFFSGFESGSISATFTLMELAKHKEVQNKARQEVKQAIVDHGWTYEAFNSMNYLEQCIFEGMRMYPPVPCLDRCAREDYKIPGTDVVIERGTGVYVSACALHHSPKYFQDPDKFDPDRFQGCPQVDAFLPFGIGPRMCIGLKLGLLHVKVVLALLLSEYQLHYAQPTAARLDQRATFTVAQHRLDIEFKKIRDRPADC